MNEDVLKKAVTAAGGIGSVAKSCNRSHEAVRKWLKNGLPRTEWTGETNYSEVIAGMQNTYTASELLVRPGAA